MDFEISFNRANERDIFKVGYLGNDSFWQGLPTLIGAAEKLIDNKKIEFNFAGFDFNNDLIFNKLPNIKYLGRVQRKDVLNFMKDMDLLVSPRIRNSVSQLQYPQKLSEYISSSRIVLVSDVNDQKDIIIKAKCGFVIDKLDSDYLASQIESLSKMSYGEKNILCNNAHQFAKDNFSINVFSSKIQDIYRKLV